MPSLAICSRSSTSHSSRNSAAIFRAASAIRSGVSRFAGSFTRSRVKFCASARIRPRSAAAATSLDPPSTATVNDSKDFLSSSVLYRSGSNEPRIAPSTADTFPAFASAESSAKATFFTDLVFSSRTAAPTRRRSSGASNFSAFPAPAASTRFAATPCGWCISVSSRYFPVTSPLSINSGIPKRSSRPPSNTGTINASVSSWAIGPFSVAIFITLIVPNRKLPGKLEILLFLESLSADQTSEGASASAHVLVNTWLPGKNHGKLAGKNRRDVFPKPVTTEWWKSSNRRNKQGFPRGAGG